MSGAVLRTSGSVRFLKWLSSASRVEARATPSVGEILDRFPATQGLASVVGLLSRANTHGEVDPDEREVLTWSGIDGTGRTATIRRHYFTEGITL